MIPRPSGTRDTGPLPQMRQPSTCSRHLTAVQDFIVGGMENFFYNYGKSISTHPFLYIILCLAVTAACGAGLMKFKPENTGIKLWIPEDSSQRLNTDWLWEHYPPERRFASMIFEADDILTPEVIQAMYRARKSVEEVTTEHGKTWSDLCIKVPVVKPPDISAIFGKQRRRRATLFEDQDDIDEEFRDFDKSFAKLSESLNKTIVTVPTTSVKTSTTTQQPSSTKLTKLVSQTSATPATNEDDFFVPSEDDFNFAEEVEADSSPTSIGDFFSIEYYPKPYCNIAEEMPTVCLEMSILELWAQDGKYDDLTDQLIANLTKESILDTINNVNKSGAFLVNKNFTDYLGGVTRDWRGRIVSAKASVIRWFGRMNATDALQNPVKDRNEPIDRQTLEFEGLMIKQLLNTSGYPKGLRSFPNAQRSFGDIAGSTILGDISFMTIGFMIVYAYVMVMLGKFSCVEQRLYLSVVGILGIIMGIIVSYGLCSSMGLFFGPLHNVLPFLLLGIGIDDMFVIVQSWETLPAKDQTGTLQERFGKTLAHSGVAITITSVTDIVAFAIGGTTVLPALKSFCLFASVGIVAIYWFQCTFFVAWMSLDQRRIESHRNGCLPCYKHKEYTSNAVARKNISQVIFQAYGNFLMKKPVKVVVILLTVCLTGIGIWGNVLLEQKFDPTWFLPPDSYLGLWFKANREYFPFGGDRVTIWCSGLNYFDEFEQLDHLAQELSKQTDIIDNVDSWTTNFVKYVRKSSSKKELRKNPLKNETFFNHKLTQFLYSPSGGKYRDVFRFEGDLKCGSASPKVLLSDVTFRHKIFSGPSEHIPAMNRVKKIIRDANLSGKVFPLSQGYAGWETDEVIAEELYRNLGLAVLCIFVTTLILIGHLICSLMVLFMVFLSLIDVGGFMHFWGLTIDTVSCVNIIIAIGLCVDYSAHIAHRFLIEHGGTREERICKTLTNIGPAVMNGGISTFLAFILLANSQSHVFSSFFKIFFLVVVFGLFQGLVVLPVVLSFVGPEPNVISATPSETDQEMNFNGPSKDKNSGAIVGNGQRTSSLTVKDEM